MAPAIPLRQGDALIVVDLQNDFLPGGSLAVPHGDEVIPVLNACLALFRLHALPIYATRDWHPPDHCSFAAQGGPWPPHCIAGSEGAEFARMLALPEEAVVVAKADTPQQDAYSGFEGTDLDLRLRRQGVTRVAVGGLATDYCVLNTVKDARRLGYDVLLLQEAIRAVDVNPGDGQRAIEQMIELGARPVAVAELIA